MIVDLYELEDYAKVQTYGVHHVGFLVVKILVGWCSFGCSLESDGFNLQTTLGLRNQVIINLSRKMKELG